MTRPRTLSIGSKGWVQRGFRDCRECVSNSCANCCPFRHNICNSSTSIWNYATKVARVSLTAWRQRHQPEEIPRLLL
jgi:hypothetical protein